MDQRTAGAARAPHPPFAGDECRSANIFREEGYRDEELVHIRGGPKVACPRGCELERIIEPHGVIVHLNSCTQCRGIREMGARTRTIERRGAYISNHQPVAEFMSLAGVNH
jgi:hypothetical protein